MFHLKKNKIEIPGYRQFGQLRLVSIFIIGIIFFSSGFSLYFIYKNIYQAIAEMQNIVILKSELGMEVIDFDKLAKVEEEWQNKHQDLNVGELRDPFDFQITNNTTSTPTTTTR